MPIASIDIGTNTAILLIAKQEDSLLKTIHHEAQMPRLGEDIKQTRQLKPEAIERTVAVLRDYKKTIEKHSCEQILIIATAACRLARNVLDFTARVQEELGLNVMIIPGEEEARLIHKTCAREFHDLGQVFTVLDIGGGSTEIITSSEEDITYNSLDFGVVTLTQQFLHSDPPTKKDLKTLRDYIREKLAPYKQLATSDQRQILIATAGTPTTLSALHQQLEFYDHDRVHKSKLSKANIQTLLNKLVSMPLSERKLLPCLPPKRADVIIAGTIILDVVLEEMNIEELHVSDHGLAHGIIYDMLPPTSE